MPTKRRGEEKMRFLIVWLIVSAVFIGASIGGVELDLLINGWLRDVSFSWTQLFTSQHGVALLCLHSPKAFWILASVLSTLGGLFISAVLTLRD